MEGKTEKKANIGQENTFNLKVKIPDSIDKFYSFVVEDTLDNRLTLTSNLIKVYLEDKNGNKTEFSDVNSIYQTSSRNIKATVTYKISTTLPSNIETYKEFKFYDKLDERLDYVNGSAIVNRTLRLKSCRVKYQ
ncbi:MAG: isopeptide-forming domain-containing fimbrial protein [Clostridioides sp.]|nr:isopeptide-forming domain-containing fimbrial protein [Clostridioides sp.]